MSKGDAMAKNYMTYWRPRTVDEQERGLLAHSAGGQLQRVEPGDTVWIVTVRPPGHLSLLGRIVVGMVTDYEGAKRILHGEDIWQAPWHIIAQAGTERLLREVDLTSIAGQLCFQSETAPRLDVVDGHVDAKQLQAMRVLTPETAHLLEVYETAPSYWWVNHSKTYRVEIDGSFIWAPQSAKGGAKRETYTNLTSVRPGDQIFSYANSLIQAVGTVTGACLEQRKPEEYKSAGNDWDLSGWRVPVKWHMLTQPLSPKTYMSQIRPLLPTRYSPLDKNGNGTENCDLASISESLATLLRQLMSSQDALGVAEAAAELRDEREGDAKEQEIRLAPIPETEKQQLISARRGQDRFRRNVRAIETKCRLTGISDNDFLVASHIKPWADSSNLERLDGNNGLMLAPHVDWLFDHGWISFTDDGDLLCANDTVRDVMQTWGLPTSGNVGSFNNAQRTYLAYHRGNVYLGRLIPSHGEDGLKRGGQ